MNDYPPDRRQNQYDGAYILAILYTLGYLAMVGLLMFFEIPQNNREVLLTLVGIMSAAQLGIIKFFYDGTQGQVKSQAANIARAARTESALQEIAKTVPVAAAVAAAAAPVAPVVPTAPIQAENVQVDAINATLTERKDSTAP